MTKSNLVLAGEDWSKTIDLVIWLLVSPGGRVQDAVSLHIQKVRLIFANLGHLRRLRDIRLSIRGQVYTAAGRSVLLYRSETAFEERIYAKTSAVSTPFWRNMIRRFLE